MMLILERQSKAPTAQTQGGTLNWPGGLRRLEISTSGRLGCSRLQQQRQKTKSARWRLDEYGVYDSFRIVELESFRKRFYEDRRKVVPEDLTLTSLSMAVWFMDDGSRKSSQCRGPLPQHSELHRRRSGFSAVSYSTGRWRRDKHEIAGRWIADLYSVVLCDGVCCSHLSEICCRA